MFATLRRFVPAALAALLLVWGCSDPVSNPQEAPSPYRDGEPLMSPTADLTIGPRSDKPWIITEDFVIPAGVTVTIQPGTEIMVAGLNWIDVQGVVNAVGSPEAPIIFTSANTAPDLGQWRGIKLHNPTDISRFEYCIFTYGAYFETDTLSDRGRDAQNYKGMLAINNSSPEIRHCVITQNQNNAVFVTNGSSRPVIEFCVMTRNDASGVRADSSVFPENLSISYNCIADNSAPGFILTNDNPDTSLGTRRVFGDPTEININLDSCDSHFNIDLEPLFVDPREDEFTILADYNLQSCSPCVDAGPVQGANDPDGTRADMGTVYYRQAAGELRGRLETDLTGATYRMSCDVVIPPGVTVTMAPGTKIEATGLFRFEVYGTLLAQGTASAPVELCPCLVEGDDIMSGMIFFERGDAPSLLQHVVINDYQEVVVNKAGVRFENCTFAGGFLGGVEVATGTINGDSAVVFDHCTFTEVGAYGVGTFASSAKILNTRISGSRGRGIEMSFVEDGVEITNTVVEACSATAVYMTNFSHPRIVNNTINECGYYGIHMTDNSRPTLLNNIVTRCGRFGLLAEFSSAPFIDYNDVWNNGLRDATPANYSPSTLDMGNGISADPVFTAGYRLGAGSPCENAGHPDAQYNDADGSRNDIGAWGGPRGGTVGNGLRRQLLAQR